MKNSPQLVIGLILATIAIACLCLWLFCTGALSDFGLNAMTETLGIGATVFVIDYLIRRHETQRILPQRASAYEDVRLLASRIVSFWTEAYRVSVPKASPETIEELLSEESINLIGGLLYMDSQANITPKRTCWDWVSETLTDFKTRSERILERHNTILEPDAYSTVHTIASDIMEPGLMRGILQSDREMGFPRPKTLGNFCFFQRSHFNSVLRLVDWCKRERAFLEKNGYTDLKRVTDTVHPWTSNENPKCMIPLTVIEAQKNELVAFRKKTEKA